jgi:hypothetical protein
MVNQEPKTYLVNLTTGLVTEIDYAQLTKDGIPEGHQLHFLVQLKDWLRLTRELGTKCGLYDKPLLHNNVESV